MIFLFLVFLFFCWSVGLFSWCLNVFDEFLLLKSTSSLFQPVSYQMVIIPFFGTRLGHMRSIQDSPYLCNVYYSKSILIYMLIFMCMYIYIHIYTHIYIYDTYLFVCIQILCAEFQRVFVLIWLLGDFWDFFRTASPAMWLTTVSTMTATPAFLHLRNEIRGSPTCSPKICETLGGWPDDFFLNSHDFCHATGWLLRDGNDHFYCYWYYFMFQMVFYFSITTTKTNGKWMSMDAKIDGR